MLFVFLGTVSCNIKEDMSDCPGRMILDYSAYSDLILDDIDASEQIRVFIFDPNGICCDVRDFTYGELQSMGMEFTLPIRYRGYNAVVWHGIESENYDSRSMAIGVSCEDFYLSLIAQNQSCQGALDPLWASQLEPIKYCAKITRHRVHMVRLHTEIRLTYQEKLADRSLKKIDARKFNATINAADDVYHTDYTISEEDSGMLFKSEGEDIGTLRLTPNMDCRLKVEGVDCNLDLIKYMLETKTDTSQSNQRFLDLNKVWEITLIVREKPASGYTALGIRINGWVRWFSESDLS